MKTALAVMAAVLCSTGAATSSAPGPSSPSRFSMRADGMAAMGEQGGLRLELTRSAARVSIPRSPGEDLWLELRPRDIPGFQATRLELRSAGAGAERLTAHRTESWWLRPHGFEQTFRIERRDEASAGPLRVEMELVSPLMRQVQEKGQTILFLRRGVPVLRVSKLFAADAGGRALPVRFELAPGRLDLVVEDAGATYPVTIDPMFEDPQVVAYVDPGFEQWLEQQLLREHDSTIRGSRRPG